MKALIQNKSNYNKINSLKGVCDMKSENVKNVDAFASERAVEDDGSTQKFRNTYDTQYSMVKRIEKMRLLELQALKIVEDRDGMKYPKELSRIQKKYSTLLEGLATNILSLDSQKHPKDIADFNAPLTEPLKMALNREKDRLIEDGFVEITKHQAVSIVSGKVIDAGVLFLRIKGDTSACIALDECTEENKFGLNTVLCCYCA